MIENSLLFSQNDTNNTDNFIYNASDEIINDEIIIRLNEWTIF